MVKLKKRYGFIGVLFLIVFFFLFSFSFIVKGYLIKYGEKATGRKIAIGELHFDYARVAVRAKDLVLFEENKSDPFLSFSSLYINFNPWALIRGEYSFSEITLVRPWIHIVQDGEKFNFDSLFPVKDTAQVTKKNSSNVLKFSVSHVRLTDGLVKYTDLQNNNEIVMNKLDLDLPLIAWNNEHSNMGLDFRIGEKGQVHCKARVDHKNQKCNLHLGVQDFDIQMLKNYLTGYFDVSSLNGLLDADLDLQGDLNEIVSFSMNGKAGITGLSVFDRRSGEIFSSPAVSASIKNIDLKAFHFGFGKIEVTRPEVQLVREKEMTNVERFFLPWFSGVTMPEDSAAYHPEEAPVTYSIDTLRVTEGVIEFNDRTLNRPFLYTLSDLNLSMTGLTESADKIAVTFRTRLNHQGELSGSTVWSMADLMNLEVAAKVKRVDLVSFSPYSEYYLASPITQGFFNYDLDLEMTSRTLRNQNGIKIDELEFGKRTDDTTATKVPVRLALYLMKDMQDEIKFDLPVSGNPSDPRFRLGKIIWKTFVNLVVKTAASPFTVLAKQIGRNPESFERITFSYAQDSLDQVQLDELTKLAELIKKKPDLLVTFTQTTDPDREKGALAILLAKSTYLASQSTVPDSLRIAGLRNEDAGLLAWIRKTVPEMDSIGMEKACLKIVDPAKIDTRFQEILGKRNRQISDFMVKNQGLSMESVLVGTADLANLPQEMRTPQFKIEVSLK